MTTQSVTTRWATLRWATIVPFLLIGCASEESPVAVGGRTGPPQITGPTRLGQIEPAFIAAAEEEVRLESGVRVRLEAVSDHVGRTSWSPDGAPLDDWVGAERFKEHFSAHPPGGAPRDDFLSFVFSVTLPKGAEHSSLSIQVLMENPPAIQEWIELPGEKQMLLLHAFVGPFPGSDGPVNLLLGVADGDWETALSVGVRDGKPLSESAGLEIEGRKDSFAARLTVPPAVRRQAVRVIAIGAEGSVTPSWSSRVAHQVDESSEFNFAIDPTGVTRLHVQTRAYTWIEFRDVQTMPDGLRASVGEGIGRSGG
jgi:hypothetical protein